MQLVRYVQDVVPAINEGHARIATSMQRLVEGLPDDVRVRRLRHEVATPLRQLLREQDDYDFSPALDAAHAEAIAALRTVVEEVRVLIACISGTSNPLVDQLTRLRTSREDDHWNRWLGALERLVDAGAT